MANAVAGKDKTLLGTFPPAGNVTLEIRFRQLHGVEFRIYKFAFADISMTCTGGTTTAISIAGRNQIRNDAPSRDKFGLGVAEGDPDNPSYAWIVRGKLFRAGTARGTVRAYGSAVPVEGDGTDSCDSGLIRWSATN